MKKRAADEELEMPFSVMWGHEEKYECFREANEAFNFIDKLAHRAPIWLLEIGTYSTEKGTAIRDWIYFWWNEEAAWGKPPFHESKSAKSGYPYGAPNRMVDYQPFRVVES